MFSASLGIFALNVLYATCFTFKKVIMEYTLQLLKASDKGCLKQM